MSMHVNGIILSSMKVIFLLLVVGFCSTSASAISYLKRLINEDSTLQPASLELFRLAEKQTLHISKAPNDQVIEHGAAFSLHCEAQGIPVPVLRWNFMGKSAVQSWDSGRNTVEMLMNFGKETLQSSLTTARLDVPCASFSHSGIYECVADNGYSTVVASAVVEVKPAINHVAAKSVCKSKESNSPEAPKIYMWTDFRFEIAGASAQLFCRTSGNPKPNVKWYRLDGEEIKKSPSYAILDTGDLLIKHGQWDDAGLYLCKAENEVGSTEVQSFYYPTAPDENEFHQRV